ncbi:hypothetical protein [Microbacterium sp. K24]|uniref:hypothetical protein n=1 Tax=Microbacterium sp. K24 TaxID=2305446 RepID=UPI00109C9B30|nr:hypothetical protein [Microbacterium sp. K24]
MTRAIRSRVVFLGLAVFLSAMLFVLGGFIITNLASRVDAANERDTQKSEQISALLGDLHASQENAQRLYDQLLALGESPQGEAPDDVVTPIPEDGRDGRDGARGPGPTALEVLDGIRACFAAGTCTAPKGDKGDPGTNGTNGTNGGDGARGADSTVPGPAGAPGVGVATIACLEDGTWQFVMTDGTTRDVPGPCRFVLITEPTPDPAPETPEGDPTP